MEGLARLVTGRRSAWAVIAGWVVVLAVAVPLARSCVILAGCHRG